MRFLHTADWHVGKNLNGFDLLADQQNVFEQIEGIAQDKQVDGVVIAGDLYDRSIPSEAAVHQLNQELVQLNLVDHLPILAISGNHDSATRLGTGADWFVNESFYLNTTLTDAFRPVTVGDTEFFLLPYFGIQAVRNYFGDDKIHNVNDAMERIVGEMQKNFTPALHHVLVAHFFAAGSERTADSETTIEVGGLSAVATTTLAPFDYVALGHLHNRNALRADRIRYSGSPMKFSVSEAGQEKGVWIIDTVPFNAEWVPLRPAHDIHKIKGTFADLVANSPQQPRDDFYDVELTDHERIPDVLNKLRERYPKIVSLHRTHEARQIDFDHPQTRRQQSPTELLADFYQQTMGIDMTDQQAKWAANALTAIKGEEE
ncbi:exonuclease SbcCD subunit D [Limosilactobacillus sp.]|uniref:exonuclease SbcCD subunit D n=1 Tax=Limosilactobacillus sp. TaxID=2773925 RepID=UPI003F0B8435